MSLKDARKFVVDFNSDPTLRLKIAEVKISKDKDHSSNYDKLRLMRTAAKERGYNFTVDELKEANDCTFGEMDDMELLNVAGGLDANEYALNRAFPSVSIGELFDMDFETMDISMDADMESD